MENLYHTVRYWTFVTLMAIADFIHHISNGLTFSPKEVRNDKIMFHKDNQLLGVYIKQSDPYGDFPYSVTHF